MRRFGLGVFIFAIILIPFALWGGAIDDIVDRWLTTKPALGLAVPALVGLLAADIILPVPSSLICTASGTLLGFLSGFVVNWTGLMAGSMLGYWIGIRAGRRLVMRWLDEADLMSMERAYTRYGDWLVVVFRAVPVLAEVSAFFAGINAFPLMRYALMSAGANLGLAALYAAVGHWALQSTSFAYAFLASLLLPWLGLLFAIRRGGK